QWLGSVTELLWAGLTYVGCPAPLGHHRMKGGNSTAGSAQVRCGSKADMCGATADVRFTSRSGHVHRNSACPLCANSEHCAAYSITASTRAKALPDGTGARGRCLLRHK